jgi:hypothetical protein
MRLFRVAGVVLAYTSLRPAKLKTKRLLSAGERSPMQDVHRVTPSGLSERA